MTLMNIVVITNMVVKLTVNAASKKKDLKNVVQYPMMIKRMVGRKVVKISLVRRRLKIICIFTPKFAESKRRLFSNQFCLLGNHLLLHI